MGNQWGAFAKYTSTWIGAGLAVLAIALAAQQPNPAAVVEQEGKQEQVRSSYEPLPPLIRSVHGSDLYHAYCASCHGEDAKGTGPAVPVLKPAVPDLTVLARNNHGVFPEAHVRQVIMGEDVLAAHGSREMPIWGPIFHQVEEDVDRGNVRLDNLVKYLESIQALK